MWKKNKMVRRKNVIAIMSPKGGVGKTITTVNLAAALATEFNKKVLAIDTNVSTSSLGLHLDIFYPKKTLNDLGKNELEIKKAIHIYHENLHVLPSSIQIKKDRDIFAMRRNISKIIQNYDKLLENLSKEYDLILLDCAPGYDLETIAAMKVAGALLLVSNPEYPAIVTAIRAIEYASAMKIPFGGIILNKVTGKKYELTKEEIEEALKVKVIEEIPFDSNVPESIAKRVPIVLFKPNSKASLAYKQLAASLTGETYNSNFLNKLKRFFKRNKKKGNFDY
jgi:septum site-determining protein MinD